MSFLNDSDEDEEEQYIVNNYYRQQQQQHEGYYERCNGNRNINLYFEPSSAHNQKGHIVILTVPHSGPSVSYQENGHPKDYFAESAFSRVSNHLINKKLSVVSFLNEKVPRAKCDLNRDVAMKSFCGFRPKLTEYIHNNINISLTIPVLLDIHSFPPGSGNPNAFPLENNGNGYYNGAPPFNRPTQNNDFYILIDDIKEKKHQETYNKALKLAISIVSSFKQQQPLTIIAEGALQYNRLVNKDNGVTSDDYILCGIYKGIHNSIITEAISNEIPGILIEFNETLKYDDAMKKNKLNRICESISRNVKNYIFETNQ